MDATAPHDEVRKDATCLNFELLLVCTAFAKDSENTRVKSDVENKKGRWHGFLLTWLAWQQKHTSYFYLR